MNIVSTETVWLTAKEAEQAIRDYVKAKGFKVYNHAQVSGLGDLGKGEVVSVQTSRIVNEVKS